MKILDTKTIRQWDEYTIKQEPISSLGLMERAAAASVHWLDTNNYLKRHFIIFCAKGNNGGDGLAIARLLFEKKCSVTVFILEFGNLGTLDFQQNLQRLHHCDVEIKFVQGVGHFHSFTKGDIIIDALMGSGLNRPLEGITKQLVEHINNAACEIISIDIPTGLSADTSSKGNAIIKARHTLSFQCYKPAFLVAENAPYIGNIHILDIGLHADFYENAQSKDELIDANTMAGIYRPRNEFSHKGDFGHALLVAGSYGKTGAAVLAARACLRSGAGLVTVLAPEQGYEILQTSIPEAMVATDDGSELNSRYTAIGIGPGMGTSHEAKKLLKKVLEANDKPLVADADALNILSAENAWLNELPPFSILTPHPKEFERLFGKSENDFARVELARQKSKELNVIIVLKGHHTFIATPGGSGYFNSTGNAGMATGGSGDVLTGIITGLLAQGYLPLNATILGIFLHGLAGDLAASSMSMEAMIASDIVEKLGAAFKMFQ